MSSGRVERQRAGEPAIVDPAAEADGGVAPPGTGPPAGLLLVRYGVVALVTLAVVALLVLLGYGLLRRQGGSFAGFAVNAVGQQGRIRPGPAPAFEVQLFSGGTFDLEEQRGRVVLVNFWAPWCPPCREEAPVLERAWRRYRDRGVVLAGVDVWDREEDARAFLREFGLTYPNGPDRGGTAVDYGVTGIPETFFIRPDGTVARHWIGPLTDEQLSAFIEEVLR